MNLLLEALWYIVAPISLESLNLLRGVTMCLA
jgi:hypothetical protein